MTTLKEAKSAHPLASIVLRQLGGGREAVETARDAGKHGADSGWGGFIYYSETVPWAKRHRRAILACAQAMADDCGVASVSQMVADFGCVKGNATAMEVESVLMGAGDDDLQTIVWNALAWFALEEVGRAIEGDA